MKKQGRPPPAASQLTGDGFASRHDGLKTRPPRNTVATGGAGDAKAQRTRRTFGIYAEARYFVGGRALTGCNPGT